MSLGAEIRSSRGGVVLLGVVRSGLNSVYPIEFNTKIDLLLCFGRKLIGGDTLDEHRFLLGTRCRFSNFWFGRLFILRHYAQFGEARPVLSRACG